MILILRKAIVCILLSFLSLSSYAINKQPIVVGMSADLSGPAKAIGNSMVAGLNSYFKRVNVAGGIHGRPIKLIVLDDQYDPIKTAFNVRHLIKEHQVLTIIGNMGTASAVLVAPIIRENHVLLFGPISGAEILRNDTNHPFIINVRASFSEETEAIISGLMKARIKPHEIAFFTQNDALGASVYAGGISALKAHGATNVEQIAHGRFTRDSLNIEHGLATILESSKPKAIIMVGTSGACAKFIRMAKKVLPKAIFLNISFVDATQLKNKLGTDSNGVIITQVVPNHEYVDKRLHREFISDLEKNYPKQNANFIAFEAYITAKIFVRGLKNTPAPITRSKIIKGIETLQPFDIGLGVPINLSKIDHQALHNVWPTIIIGNQFIPFEWRDLRGIE